jgi:hypothetical protein
VANDGRTSASQAHVDYGPDAQGGVSASQAHVDYATTAQAGVSASQAHVDFGPTARGGVATVYLMVEFTDSGLVAEPAPLQGFNVQRRARRIQGTRFKKRVGQWIPKKSQRDPS